MCAWRLSRHFGRSIASLHRRFDCRFAVLAVHRLDEEMIERPAFQLGGVDPLLRPHQLELVARSLNDFGPRLRAYADPVEPGGRRQRPVGLHRDAEAARVQRVDQRGVQLEHRLAAGDDHEPASTAVAPQCLDMGRKRVGARELAAAFPVGPDEVRVAEACIAPLARSCSRPDHRLHPAKRRNTARLPDCTPSPCSVRKHSLTA